MFFYEVRTRSMITYLVLINLPFVNIFYIVYLLYSYNIHPLYRKLAKYLFIPVWIFLYWLSYTSARMYLVG